MQELESKRGNSWEDKAPPAPISARRSTESRALRHSGAARREQRGDEKAAGETEKHQGRYSGELPLAAAQSCGCLEVHNLGCFG